MNLPGPTIFHFSGNSLLLQKQGWIGKRVVLSRGACVHFRLAARGVPLLKLKAYLRLQLAQYQIYSDTGFFALHVDDVIHLWVWDNAPLKQAFNNIDLEWGAAALIPESIFAVPPAGRQAATSLIQCMAGGFEGVTWENGKPGDFAWWPELPSSEEWQAFSKHVKPPARARVWSDRAPGRRINFLPRANTSARQIFTPVKLWTGLWGLIFGYAGFLGGQALQLQNLHANAVQDYELILSTAETTVRAREDALNIKVHLDMLSKFQASPDLLQIWADLGESLPLNSMALRDFDYRAGEFRMTVVASGKRIDASTLLRILESTQSLHEVRLELNSAMKEVRVLSKWKPTSGAPL